MSTPTNPSEQPGPAAQPSQGADPAALAAAVAALNEGKVVGLPTETVYGLAARADMPAALTALIEAKGSPDGRGFTWHAADVGALEFFPELRPLAERLADRYWPGPLTLVLHGVPAGLEATAVDGWCGVRVPGQADTRAILQSVAGPVIASSANRAGEPPALDASAVRRIFPEQETVHSVLDVGAAPLGQASTVLALGYGRFEVLRSGVLELEELRRTAGMRIGFVCTGNTCRSPMAETMARALLTERLGGDPAAFGFQMQSMGVTAGPGSPASEGSLAAVAELGLDLSEHQSTPAASAPLGEFDALYCMTSSHRAMLLSALPPALGARVHLLDPAGHDVPDPYGGNLNVYRGTRDAIGSFLDARLADWA